MFDPERLLGQMIGGALGGAFGGRGGSRRSGFRTGNIAGKAQLGIGLLGVAMAAWEHYSSSQAQGAVRPGAPMSPPPPPPPRQSATSAPAYAPGPPPPPPAAPVDARGRDMLLMVQAMIAAAAADGRIDDEERNGIHARAESAGLDAQTRAFLQRELDAPRSLEAIVAAARPEIAGDLYAASAFAISIDTDAERAWLDRLAAGLGLTPQTRATIHQQLGRE